MFSLKPKHWNFKQRNVSPGGVPREDGRDALDNSRYVGMRVSFADDVQDPLHLVHGDQQSL